VPTADFVAEGTPIPVQIAPTSAGPSLVPHKLAVLTSLTGEMLRSTNVETMVRQVLIEATGPAVDRVLFSANAAGTDRPAGLLAGITALTPAAAGEKAQAIVDDLQALALTVAPWQPGAGGFA
jgi:HK97 family phage major capsid protein